MPRRIFGINLVDLKAERRLTGIFNDEDIKSCI